MTASLTAVGWQRAEGALVFAASLAVYVWAGAPLGLWPAVLVFLLPDLAMIAYAAGPKSGAIVYNLAHLYGGGAVLAAAGLALGDPALAASGLLWAGHVGMDRMLGYGLKLPQGFGHTHLGRTGR